MRLKRRRRQRGLHPRRRCFERSFCWEWTGRCPSDKSLAESPCCYLFIFLKKGEPPVISLRIPSPGSNPWTRGLGAETSQADHARGGARSRRASRSAGLQLLKATSPLPPPPRGCERQWKGAGTAGRCGGGFESWVRLSLFLGRPRPGEERPSGKGGEGIGGLRGLVCRCPGWETDCRSRPELPSLPPPWLPAPKQKR